MKQQINWTVWLILVVLWNFGFPKASPMEDVLVAVFLSVIFILLRKYQKNG